MPLPPELESIAARLTHSELKNRNEDTRVELARRQDEAMRAGRHIMGYYAFDQQKLCLREINHRADVVWGTYKRLISEAGIPWTDDLRQDALARLGQLLDRDIPQLDDMARLVIAPHGHGFAPFLTNARDDVLERITAEIDFFAFKYRPVGAAVVVQLQADRYSGPRQHWTEARAALQQSPPRFTHSAREAIHAVEGMAKIVVQQPEATLGECIKVLKKRGSIDGGTANTLESLWGLTNTTPGLRHGGTEEHVLAQPLAQYVVGLAEAALAFLLSLDVPAA